MHLEQEEFLRLARLAGLPPEAEDWEALKPALLEMEGFGRTPPGPLCLGKKPWERKAGKAFSFFRLERGM